MAKEGILPRHAIGPPSRPGSIAWLLQFLDSWTSEREPPLQPAFVFWNLALDNNSDRSRTRLELETRRPIIELHDPVQVAEWAGDIAAERIAFTATAYSYPRPRVPWKMTRRLLYMTLNSRKALF